MSGIIEAILVELQQINAKLSGAVPAALAAPVQPVQPVAAPAAPAAIDPFAAAPVGAPNGSGQITEAMVMGLIEPHLENAALKAGLSAVLAQMGIARLPEARPDQYPAMYTAFQQVIAQHAAPAAAAPTSII